MKVLSIFGTRPEAVKMAPVVKILVETPGIDSYICITAQHRQMLDQVMDLFELKADVDLNLMRTDQSLASLTAELFSHLDPVFCDIQPDWVLVQGDTTTVMAAAILAYYHRVRVGHVEAGLRTGDKWQPFPEEVNRRVTGVTADLNFAPTERSRQNLLREGVQAWRILVTGNTVIDALREIIKLPVPPQAKALLDGLGITDGIKQLVLVTAHRRENLGQPLEEICAAIRQLAQRYCERLEFVYPVHLNPNVQEPVYRLLAGIENIHLTEPLDYLPLVHLLKSATLVLTDSGGIQEEATALSIPTLVMRNVTERPEGVEAGVLKLVGTNQETIINMASRLLEDPAAYRAMVSAKNPFGDGHAAGRIVTGLLNFTESDDS